MLTFYVLDTETTGLSTKMHEICEYSVIRCSDRVQLSRQIRCSNPRNASADALLITGKTIQDLYQGISKDQAIQDFNNFIEQDGLTPEHRCIVAHNGSFDRRFMHEMWTKRNTPFPIQYWIDTVPMCKKLAAQMGQPKAKVKLDLVVELFGLTKYAGTHTAKGDTRNTYSVWNHLLANKVGYLDCLKSHPHMTKKEEAEDDDQDLTYNHSRDYE